MFYSPKHAQVLKGSPARRRIAGVAVVGATAAVGSVAAAQSASASSVWDAVAQCESGGNWSTSTGNGFYGGLQFTHQTWQAFGGGAYGYNADDATREQQIEIAQKVLQAQGPGAWPVCSVQAGLTSGGAAYSGDISAPVPEQAPVQQTAPAQQAPVEPAAPQAPVQQAPAQPTDLTEHVIQPGETTSLIAQAYGTTVAQLVDINGLSQGGALIYAGDVMLVPADGAQGDSYTVQRGDTLSSIARRHGISVSALVALNHMRSTVIVPGQQLQVALNVTPPNGAGRVPTTPASSMAEVIGASRRIVSMNPRKNFTFRPGL